MTMSTERTTGPSKWYGKRGMRRVGGRLLGSRYANPFHGQRFGPRYEPRSSSHHDLERETLVGL